MAIQEVTAPAITRTHAVTQRAGHSADDVGQNGANHFRHVAPNDSKITSRNSNCSSSSGAAAAAGWLDDGGKMAGCRCHPS
jgi:hypothetical protein